MTANDVLNVARADLGYTESPAGSNKTKFGQWYGLDGQPWCMMAVQYWFDKAGMPLPYKTASCPAMVDYAQKVKKWYTGDFKPGDVVLYNFNSTPGADHVGIVESATAAGVTAIEGNTSLSSDDNGGAVMRRYRANNVILGVYRPDYESGKNEDNSGDEEMTYEKFKEYMEQYLKDLQAQEPSSWSKEAREWAEKSGIIAGSGNGAMQYKAFCTREQAVTMLYQLFHMLDK